MPQQPNQTLIKKLKEMGIALPSLPTPTGNYASYMLVPPYLYLSGVTPRENGKLLYKGKVGIEVTQKEAYLAARQCILTHLTVIRHAIGDLDRIKQVIKVVGFVNTVGDFTALPEVVNGASDLLVELLGDRGKHARSAVGVASLPGGAPVEVEMVVKIDG
jgi:enamine deaminase RidA (YjgF/YER057c/UK114 family)